MVMYFQNSSLLPERPLFYSLVYVNKKKLGNPELGRRLRYDQKYPVVIVEFHDVIDLVQVNESQ